jgi:hypothetical protein
MKPSTYSLERGTPASVFPRLADLWTGRNTAPLPVGAYCVADMDGLSVLPPRPEHAYLIADGAGREMGWQWGEALLADAGHSTSTVPPGAGSLSVPARYSLGESIHTTAPFPVFGKLTDLYGCGWGNWVLGQGAYRVCDVGLCRWLDTCLDLEENDIEYGSCYAGLAPVVRLESSTGRKWWTSDFYVAQSCSGRRSELRGWGVVPITGCFRWDDGSSPERMLLYHCTDSDAAAAILKDGFQDGEDGEVWLTEHPGKVIGESWGTHALEVLLDIGADEIAEHAAPIEEFDTSADIDEGPLLPPEEYEYRGLYSICASRLNAVAQVRKVPSDRLHELRT